MNAVVDRRKRRTQGGVGERVGIHVHVLREARPGKERQCYKVEKNGCALQTPAIDFCFHEMRIGQKGSADNRGGSGLGKG
jgi:hypothetical protein